MTPKKKKTKKNLAAEDKHTEKVVEIIEVDPEAKTMKFFWGETIVIETGEPPHTADNEIAEDTETTRTATIIEKEEIIITTKKDEETKCHPSE